MVKAYVLITSAVGKVKVAYEGLRRIPEVKSAHVVTGAYDIIAFIEADDLSKLTSIVVEEIHRIDGVIDTNTAIVIEV